ncbi:carbohydrate-binding protein [Solibaculum mannosilyticum]|uniref:carbohydrate-binding protein n=1 Tax=Solibaculum mannosilyticum TaxID=2780922 RepID=UPI0034AA922F
MKKARKALAFIMAAAMCVGTMAPAVSANEPDTTPADQGSSAPYAGEDRMYAIATSHLDTVWVWDLETTIKQYIPDTLEDNFSLFERYPDYVFNFEGAYRYQLMEEYYPEEFETLKKYMDSGNWNFSGSGLENGDVNTPSPEALFRNFLYGNNYIEEKFGAEQRSRDVYLPDCFGFGYALPSIAAHSNLLGFTTQKLTWGNSFENGALPFDIGTWTGVDGSTIIANINPGNYVSTASTIRNDSGMINKLNKSKFYGYSASARLFGMGDMGGGSSASTVETVLNEQAMNDTETIKVINATTDQLFLEMTEEEKASLPNYNDEMVMQEHGTGTYTSRVISKRWNRQNELMADNAERSLVTSSWLGATEYPQEKLTKAWTNVIAHQFHDDITGTSIDTAYTRSWNEYMVDLKQFAAEYENGVDGVASEMDTSVESGVPLVVNNPVAADRNDLVEATVTMPEDCTSVRVYDADGNEVASQVLVKDGNQFDIVFMANVGSMGYRTYNVRPAATACDMESNLSVSENKLSNEKYDVTIDENGDISSIFDKELDKELLAEPIRLALFDDTETGWPSWELNMSDYWNKERRESVKDEAMDISVVEDGPARVAIRVVRQHGSSTYDQVISLTSGGQIVAVDNVVDWDERATLLKAEFNLTSSNPTATYDLGLGAIERGNNTDRKAEVPLQKWADLSATDDSYGVSILNDCKYGMDKYDDDTLRLTLIHTPKGDYTHHTNHRIASEATQDVGENRFGFAIYGHEGNFGSGTQIEAEAFNQPMKAFQTVSHQGSLGDDYSFGSISNENVLVRAVKKAEKSDEVVIRVNEGTGEAASNVEVYLGEGIESAREIYASEEEIGPATVKDGKLVFDIGAYGVKSFAVTLKEPTEKADARQMTPVDLPYNIDAYSSNDNKMDGSINALNETYPSELVPDSVLSSGITYQMGSKEDGQNNAVAAKGQTITLPEGYNTLHLLAASTQGDKDVTFRVGDKDVTLNIGDYKENIAAWDQYSLGITGYVKEQDPALWATHRHTNGDDNIAASTYMFAYDLDISGASTITLPDDDSIIIFAATAENDAAKTEAVSELYDHRERTDETTGAFTGYSSFEDGDPEALTNVLNNQNNTSNVTSGVTDEDAYTGTHSFKLSGNDNNDSSSFTYMKMYTNNIEILPGTILTYKFKPLNENGRYINVDMQFGNGLPLRDSGAYDTDGTRMHPASPRGTVGEWTTITCNLYEYARGRSLNNILFAYDQGGNTGEFAALVDDIFIGIPTGRQGLEYTLSSVKSIDPDTYAADTWAEIQKLVDLADKLLTDEDAYEGDIDYVAEELAALMDETHPMYDGFAGVTADQWDELSVNDQGPYVEGGHTNRTNEGHFVTFNDVTFGDKTATAIEVEYSGSSTGRNDYLEIREGGRGGELLATVPVPATGSFDNYQTVLAGLDVDLTGVHDICIDFRCRRNVKSIRFVETVDKTNLDAAIAEAEEIDRSSATEDSLAVLDEKLAVAKTVSANIEATSSEIITATNDLKEAISGLIYYKSAYERLEAEECDTFTQEGDGIKFEGEHIGGITNGDWVAYDAVQFGDGAGKVEVCYAGKNSAADSRIEVRADSPDGKLLSTISIPKTGSDWNNYVVATADLSYIPVDTQKIYFVIRSSSSDICNIDYFGFTPLSDKTALNNAIAKAQAIDLSGYDEVSAAQVSAALVAALAVQADDAAAMKDVALANNNLLDAIDSLEIVRSAYDQIEAETYELDSGIVNDGPNIGGVNPGDWVGYKHVDFGDVGADSFTMYFSAEDGGSGSRKVDLWIDGYSPSTGTKIGTVTVNQTGTWADYVEVTVDLNQTVTGIHSFYMTFMSDYTHVVNIDWFKFGQAEPADTPTEENIQALKDILAEADALNADDYTADSFASVTSAVEAGKALQANPDATNTQYVEAINAIRTAIDSLVPVVVGDDAVHSASSDKNAYGLNETITLTIRTDSDVNRIALTNENGRYLGISKLSSSFDGQSDEKIWTVQTSLGTLGKGRTFSIMTSKPGSSLEKSDVSVSVDIVAPETNAHVLSVASAAQAKVNEEFVVEVETTLDVEALSIVNERGKAITQLDSQCTVNGDVKTWKITISVGSTGYRIFDIKAKDAYGLYTEDDNMTLPITITK